MARSILRTLLEAAFKKIAMAALAAGAKSFESQADIPVVGPALGAGSMLASIATVMGLQSQLPSYAKGSYFIPHDQLAILHQGERVLTRSEADASRSGGIGGMSISIVAMDSRDVGRALSDSSGEVSDAMRRLRRSNRGGW